MTPHRDSKPTDDAIETMAAAWLAQRDDGMSADRLREFAAWRALDPRHEAAVVRLEQTWGTLQALRNYRPLQGGRPDADALAPKSSQRILSFPILAAVAAVAVVALAIWQWQRISPDSGVRYVTMTGQYKRVPLSDGSIVDLNGDTEIRVEYAPSERRIRLVHGEGHFTVAKNAARPFVVRADAITVRAVGTAFDVRIGSDAIGVLVTEGRVHIDKVAAQSADVDGSTVDAGNRLVIPAKIETALARLVTEKVTPESIHAALDWQNQPLRFVDTPLREVIAQLNARNRVQITLAEADLGDLPFAGSFRADNVEGFVRLLASDRELIVERVDSEHINLRRRK